jgi:hypothetical protein
MNQQQQRKQQQSRAVRMKQTECSSASDRAEPLPVQCKLQSKSGVGQASAGARLFETAAVANRNGWEELPVYGKAAC